MTSMVLSLPEAIALPIDIYTAVKRPKGVLVFIHGMSKYGNRDERVVHFCQAAAKIGYQVIAPTYQNITNLLIDNAVIGDIEQSLLLITKHYSPEQKISVFSASYSGCMALKAIAQPKVAPLISAFGTIGSPNRFNSAYAHALGENGSKDEYAKLIFLRALLKTAENYDEVVDNGIMLAIDDAAQLPRGEALAAYLATLNTTEQQKIRDIVDNIADTQHYLEAYQHIVQQLDHELVNSADLRLLQCNVVLIHSKYDDIFRIDETVELYQELKQQGVGTRMLITPLLDHVDYKASVRQVIDVVKLIRAFGYFFKWA